MKYRLTVRDLAENDLAEAVEFYEAQETGLGARFQNEVAEVLGRIAGNPLLYATTDFPGYRRAVLKVFPFCIYYYLEDGRIAIVAVLDARRDPKAWRTRAKTMKGIKWRGR